MAALLAFSVVACSGGRSELLVEGAFTPEPALDDGAAVYLTLINNTNDRVTLTGVSADVAEDASVHQTSLVDGIARMRPLPELEIDGGETVIMSPGGTHIMLTNLSQPLRAGDQFSLRLELDPLGPVETSVRIVDPSDAFD